MSIGGAFSDSQPKRICCRLSICSARRSSWAAYHDWESGRTTHSEAQRRVDHPDEHRVWEDLVEESEKEREAFDEAREAYDTDRGGRADRRRAR